MKFKVDELPTYNDTCPFEPICCNFETYDCPKFWDRMLSMPERVDSGYWESIKERSKLRYCEFMIEN